MAGLSYKTQEASSPRWISKQLYTNPAFVEDASGPGSAEQGVLFPNEQHLNRSQHDRQQKGHGGRGGRNHVISTPSDELHHFRHEGLRPQQPARQTPSRGGQGIDKPLWRGEQQQVESLSAMRQPSSKKVPRGGSREALNAEDSDKQMNSVEHDAASQAAISLWRGHRVASAHIALQLLSVLKVLTGALWVTLPAGIVVLMAGMLGMVAASVYLTCRCCSPHSGQASSAACCSRHFPLRIQLLLAQVLAGVSIPPSAILDGMYMSGLFRGGLMETSFVTVVGYAALSVAQSAVFLFILVEAWEARRLLKHAFVFSNTKRQSLSCNV